MRLGICIPVFNDWPSAIELVRLIDDVSRGTDHTVEIMFVDDGSSDPLPSIAVDRPSSLRQVSVLRLRRNLGHQRAIAIGLSHLYEAAAHDVIVVMDGDGEDDPKQIPALLAAAEQSSLSRVVFAKRTRRTEGAGFRAGYIAFKALHRILTGRRVEVGNFSAIPRSALERLVGVSELWNHYAAAVYHARLPTAQVPLPRARRIAGKSKMNLVALVTHGLSAISVHSEVVGVRMLCFLAVAMTGVFTAIGLIVGLRVYTDLAIPGWATTAFGVSIISLLNLTLIAIAAVLFVLQSRSRSGFMPLRDYQFCVLERLQLFSADHVPTAAPSAPPPASPLSI